MPLRLIVEEPNAGPTGAKGARVVQAWDARTPPKTAIRANASSAAGVAPTVANRARYEVVVAPAAPSSVRANGDDAIGARRPSDASPPKAQPPVVNWVPLAPRRRAPWGHARASEGAAVIALEVTP